MTPKEIRTAVVRVQTELTRIEHEAWNGRTYTKGHMEMWTEASKIVPPEWQEIIRVLAQGGDYYSIVWPE